MSDDGPRRRIFLNASNVTGRGASVLVANLLPELYLAAPDAEFTTLVAENRELMAAAPARNARVLTRTVRLGAANAVGRFADLHLAVPRLVRQSRAQVCLTLGDVGPARLSCPHMIFLHNPLLVYSPSELGRRHDWSPMKRRYLQWQFRRSAAAAERLIVQTPVMRSRLIARYAVAEDAVEVVPQPVPRHMSGTSGVPGRSAIAGCTKPIRLLFLAAYYPHKNHEILPEVVREIRRRGLDNLVQIFVTLGDQAPAQLREALRECSDVVTDLGRLDPGIIADAFADASALFLPTLVESYGLIYLEAMAAARPILTSDRDFARWMCGAAARYFDPLDPVSIVDVIAALAGSPRGVDTTCAAAARLLEFPADWGEVARRFALVLRARGGPAGP